MIVDSFWAEQASRNLQRHYVCIQAGVTLIFGLHPNLNFKLEESGGSVNIINHTYLKYFSRKFSCNIDIPIYCW
jgi:hypothetical protein